MKWKPYAEYKESGVEWLGEVPKHWEVKPFRAVAAVREGQINPTDTQYRSSILIAPNHIDSGTGRILLMETVEEQEAISGKYPVSKGEIVYSKIRPALNKVCIAPVDCLCSADMYPLKVLPTANARFLFYLILSDRFVHLMVNESMRVAMPKVNRDSFGQCRVVTPLPPEQEQIADFLDRETAKIDTLISKQELLIELLQEKRQALINHAVTKGLNPDAPMKPSGVEWLGEVPAHWGINKIKHLLRSMDQGWSPQCEGHPADSDEWGVVKVGCVNSGTFDPQENKALPAHLNPMPELGLRRGDVLISRANTRDLVGRAAALGTDFPRLMLCDKLFRLRIRGELCAPGFLSRALSCPYARQSIEVDATGASSSMLNIAQSSILDLPIPAPPVPEQEAILADLTSRCSLTDQLVRKVQTAIALMREHRTALISAAVTGKIDVRDVHQSSHA